MKAFAFLLGLFSVAAAEPAHFHHVGLNVTDPAATIAFYTRIFGAVPIRYAGQSDALYTERSFILLNKVDSPPPSALQSGIWHMGWGGVDVPHEYEWLKAQGVKIHTPLYALGNIHVTYVQGPDDELIEVNTMGHHRFAHIHLLARDINETVAWYVDHLGATARRTFVPKPDLAQVRAWSNAFTVDNVSFIVYGMPDYEPKPVWWPGAPLRQTVTTKGRAIDHLAFAYRDITPEFQRMKDAGVSIVSPIQHREDVNHTSFFVEGPEHVLIEIVQANPIPESAWGE